MDATLDSLSLLASHDDNASLGPKLIVLDDLERCYDTLTKDAVIQEGSAE